MCSNIGSSEASNCSLTSAVRGIFLPTLDMDSRCAATKVVAGVISCSLLNIKTIS